MRNTLRISTRIRTVLGRAPVLMFVCIIAYLFGAGSVSTANAKESFPATASPGTVDPWEIIIYEHSNFSGMSIGYKMEPGMRQKLVPQITPGWENKVTSIQLGSKVGVYLFAGHYFYAGGPDDSRKFDQSVSKVEIDFKVQSLIVYPKAAEGPLGVWLWDLRDCVSPIGFDCSREDSFFPLPESEGVSETGWGFLGNFNLDKNANYVAFDTRYVEVTLYEGRDFQGTSLPLPGAGPHPQRFSENLGPKYSWSDRAASLKVRWKGPPLALGPPPPPPVINPVANAPDSSLPQYGVNLPGRDYKSFFVDGGPEACEKACAADPKCKAFTWVKAGVQGAKAACWLKSSVPPAVQDENCVSGYAQGLKPQEPPLPQGQGTWSLSPDISGNWQSSIGAVYKITQSGSQFTWKVKNGNEQGSGTLTYPQISASWSGDKGTGNGQGKVIVDAGGKAVRIEWSNGVVFLKQ